MPKVLIKICTPGYIFTTIYDSSELSGIEIPSCRNIEKLLSSSNSWVLHLTLCNSLAATLGS